MAEGDDTNLVRITHYINPHMFWFKYESSFLGNSKLLELDNRLQQYYIAMQKKHCQRKYEPSINEMVAVFNFSWNRWIRAKIDHIVEFTASQTRYIAWAVDYGVPLQTEARWIRELPVEFAEVQIDSVYFGGIGNILPAEKTYDFVKNCAAVEICDRWSPLAVKMIDDLISDAASIKFIREMKSKEGQLFGNLEITTHTNQLIKANIVLLETNQATTANEFFRILQELGTNKIPRWQTNEGNTLVFKYHSNKISTDKIKYDTKTYEDHRTSDLAKSEYDMEVEKKVTDWEQRNQESQFKEDVTIDDISFNDSASVAVGISVPRTTEKVKDKNEKEIEEQAYKVAGTSRKKRLERYKKYVPKPPTDSNSIPPVVRVNAKETTAEKTPTKNQITANSIISNESDIKENHNCDANKIEASPDQNKANESSDSKSATSGSSAPVVNSRVAKLLNKRRSVQAKLSKMPENVIPAGFDLRNLQPTKADKQSKNQSFQSSSSSTKEINDLSNSMSKMNFTSQNNRKQNSRPLEEVDEVW